jgi:hypothetical protein
MYNTDLPNRAELPSNKKLLTSTVIAIIVAAVLLVTAVLPAEYGIDPTRIGRVLGLTQMGEIKHKLAIEAKNEATVAPTTTVKTKTAEPVQTTPNSKTDEKTVLLKSGEGVEIKMEMVKGAKVKYEWKSSGAVNHDTHADGANKAFISYKKGTGVESDAGDLTAEFDGSHGWFWRNRTQSDVTITLKINGDYKSVKQME